MPAHTPDELLFPPNQRGLLSSPESAADGGLGPTHFGRNIASENAALQPFSTGSSYGQQILTTVRDKQPLHYKIINK